MKRILTISALLWAFGVGAASACTVEYKAKRDTPTEYRHTTMEVPAGSCTDAAAAAYVQAQLSASGWKLLAIVKISG